jgi:hypothetical protein
MPPAKTESDRDVARPTGIEPVFARQTLGYTNTAEWEAGADGAPKDPWQFVNYLPLVRLDDGEAYSFTTSSRGGLNAIGKLAGQFARLRWKHRGMVPVVAIEVGSYQHDRYGKIKFPVFRIVDWQPEGGEGAPVPDAPSIADELSDEIPASRSRARSSSACSGDPKKGPA